MKILLISSQFPPTPGGGGVYTFYLADALLSVTSSSGNRKNEIRVLTSASDRSGLQRREPNLQVHAGEFSRGGRVPYEAAIRYGLELCSSFEPDVIHGQHFDGVYVGRQLKAAFPQSVLFGTFHQSPLGWNVAGLQRRDPTVASMITLLQQADKVVTVCDFSKKELLDLGLPPEIETIWPGVNLSRLVSRAAFRKPHAAKILRSLWGNAWKYDYLILCPARLDPSKDLETFVRAAGVTQRNFKGATRFAFLIAGKSRNPDEEERKYQKHLESLATEEGILEDLRFGSFDLFDMYGIYKLSAACVLPSVREALGLVLIEAMALRVPIVAANVSGITDVISPELNALVFFPRKHHDLAEQLKRLIEDPDLANKLRDMGVVTVKNRFDHRRMGRDHYYLYKRLSGAT